MLTSHGEPPAWDAFSKVNIKNIDPSEYEDDEDLAAKKLAEEKKQNAIVKAKPTTLSGWDPETKTQSILTDEQMQGVQRRHAEPAARPPVANCLSCCCTQPAVEWERWT
jgi:GH25 family lysozyme M1 (1,4-beta-N-acetylmuramidase)